jgi:hypothetical protein
MPGGKGKSIGGKGAPKEAAGKHQKSHSAKAGLQVSIQTPFYLLDAVASKLSLVHATVACK